MAGKMARKKPQWGETLLTISAECEATDENIIVCVKLRSDGMFKECFSFTFDIDNVKVALPETAYKNRFALVPAMGKIAQEIQNTQNQLKEMIMGEYGQQTAIAVMNGDKAKKLLRQLAFYYAVEKYHKANPIIK